MPGSSLGMTQFARETTMPIDLSQHDTFLDRLLQVPQLYGAKISPDGNFVAWIWAGLAETTQLWVAAASGAEPPRCLVGDDWDCDSLRWGPDSRSIVYARSKDGDERVGLHQVFLDGRAPTALTEDRPDYYIHGGQLAKDGRTLLFSANVDDNGAEIEPTWVYVQDGPKGRRRVLARPQRAHYGWPLLSPDDHHVLYDRNDPDPAGSQLWLTDLAGSFDREIVNVGAGKKADGAWSPDGQSVVVVAEAATHRKVGLWRLASGAIEWLVDDPQRAVADADWPKRSAEIVVDETSEARPRSFLLDPVSKRERPFGPFADGQLTPVGGNPTTRPMRARRPGRGPFAPPTPQQLQAQAAAYAKLFEIFLKHKDVIGRVTIWGLNDGRSWRQGQAPLLFDAQNRPKPAFDAVIAAHH